jgi:hypothetical protein
MTIKLHQRTIKKFEAEVEVDDDNEPAIENDPTTTIIGANNECIYRDWGHDGFCPRRQQGNIDPPPKLKISDKPTVLELFEVLFPVSFLKEVVIPETNKHLEGQLSYGELLRWFGLWFLMATTNGSYRHEFWSSNDIDPFRGAPYRLGCFMSRNRFDDIRTSLRLTKDNQPVYRDRFWEIRRLIAAWIDNMSTNFSPGWVACLDESMSVWTNKYTCPGFVYVPRKPHPFGNEYHSICCGITGLMFNIELREGKDAPTGAPLHPTEGKGKTTGLLLRLCSTMLGSSRCVVLDSGFCVLKAIIELRRNGVYAASLIKKRRYWPAHVDGQEVIDRFNFEEIGFCDARHGNLGGIPFTIYGLKEQKYVLMMMSTYGTLLRQGKETKRTIVNDGLLKIYKFQYPEIVANHYKFRHMVDDHNARRHAPISLEETWATSTWTHRVLAFLIAITEVNMLLWTRYSERLQSTNNKKDYSVLAFRKVLAFSLIYNKHYEFNKATEDKRSSTRLAAAFEHVLATVPKGTKMTVEGKFIECATPYHQIKCSTAGCSARVRTYCPCSRGVYRCNECYAVHVSDIRIEPPLSALD